MSMPRVVVDEALDHLPPSDPAAQRSRRDLVRIHRVMGTRSIVANGWRSLCASQTAGSPLRVLELGAGDGTLLLGVARSLGPDWAPVHLTLLDRVNAMSPSTLAEYAALGWTAQVEVDDALTWASRPVEAPSRPARRWDLVTTTLFLHHFERPVLAALLAGVAMQADRFFACEPRRGWFALAGSHLVGALGANAVTRQDAVLSVRAGFRSSDIAECWPDGGGAWQLDEASAALFSHRFSARRRDIA